MIFKGFSHPIRIWIVEALKGRLLCVVDIANGIGYEKSVITKQLLYLRVSGIIMKTKKGMIYRYSLSNPYFANVIKCMHHYLDM